MRFNLILINLFSLTCGSLFFLAVAMFATDDAMAGCMGAPCEQRFCKTEEYVYCSDPDGGGGYKCVACGTAGGCDSFGGATPDYFMCNICGGACTMQPYSVDDSGEQQKTLDQNAQIVPKHYFAADYSSDVQELQALFSELPVHAAYLLRFEYMNGTTPIGWAPFAQVALSSQVAENAFVARSQDQIDYREQLHPTGSSRLAGPEGTLQIDRYLEVRVIPAGRSSFRIRIDSFVIDATSQDWLFEGRSDVILAPTSRADVYEVKSVSIMTVGDRAAKL